MSLLRMSEFHSLPYCALINRYTVLVYAMYMRKSKSNPCNWHRLILFHSLSWRCHEMPRDATSTSDLIIPMMLGVPAGHQELQSIVMACHGNCLWEEISSKLALTDSRILNVQKAPAWKPKYGSLVWPRVFTVQTHSFHCSQEYWSLKRKRKPDFHSISHWLLTSHLRPTWQDDGYPEDIRQWCRSCGQPDRKWKGDSVTDSAI